MIKTKKLFPIVGKSALIKNCPECGTPFKHKNVIKGFTEYCYCKKCEKIVEIKFPNKKKEARYSPLKDYKD